MPDVVQELLMPAETEDYMRPLVGETLPWPGEDLGEEDEDENEEDEDIDIGDDSIPLQTSKTIPVHSSERQQDVPNAPTEKQGQGQQGQ